VDLAYTWAETCLDRWEQNDQRWLYIMAGSTVVLYATSLAMVTVLYVFFADKGCTQNQAFITLTLLFCFAVSVMAIHPVVQRANPQSGLIQAGMVAAYTAYLVTSAIANEPTTPETAHCNPLLGSERVQTTSALLGALFTLAALVYSTTRTASQGSTLISSDSQRYEGYSLLITQDPEARREALHAAVESGALPASALQDNDGSFGGDTEAVPYNYAFFHFTFAIATMYVAMLLTNWNTLGGSGDYMVVGRSYAAMWVKVLSSWVCLGLYAWSLVAPLVFPDRF